MQSQGYDLQVIYTLRWHSEAFWMVLTASPRARLACDLHAGWGGAPWFSKRSSLQVRECHWCVMYTLQWHFEALETVLTASPRSRLVDRLHAATALQGGTTFTATPPWKARLGPKLPLPSFREGLHCKSKDAVALQDFGCCSAFTASSRERRVCNLHAPVASRSLEGVLHCNSRTIIHTTRWYSEALWAFFTTSTRAQGR